MNGISLLPDDLKEKEEKEKEKIKQAISRPGFKFHQPEAARKNGTLNAPKVEGNRVGLEIGADKPVDRQVNRGVFQIKEKNSPDILKNIPFEPSRTKNNDRPLFRKVEASNAPSTAVKPIETRSMPKAAEKIKMHVPENDNGRESGVNAKEVIREAGDKLQEIVKPQSFFNVLKHKVQTLNLKKTPAEVNLISEDYQKVVVGEFWKRLNLILIGLLIVLLIFSAAFVGLKIYKMKLIDAYRTTAYELEQVENEISSYQADAAQMEKLKDRAAVLKVMLKNHLYWTKLFDALEHHTAENVVYTNFAAEDAGKVLLSATAKSYADAGKQIYIFENADFVKNVEVSSASRSETADKNGVKANSEIQFNISLTLKDNALVK